MLLYMYIEGPIKFMPSDMKDEIRLEVSKVLEVGITEEQLWRKTTHQTVYYLQADKVSTVFMEIYADPFIMPAP